MTGQIVRFWITLDRSRELLEILLGTQKLHLNRNPQICY